MFWRFSYSTSQIQTLLEREDITLQEILDEDDVLQECKSSNDKLIEFLTKPENMDQLIDNIIKMPVNDLNEKVKFKYSNISCELLTCDMGPINDMLINNLTILDKLYSFLESSNSIEQADADSDSATVLNPLLASYFAKVIGILISRKTEQFLNYLENKENFVNLFVKHVNTSAIIDILLRLLTTIDNNDMRMRVLEWLKRVRIIENLIDLFHHKYTPQVHSNVAQVLSDIVRIAREQIYTERETLSYASNLGNPSSSLSLSDQLQQQQNNIDFDFDENIMPFGQASDKSSQVAKATGDGQSLESKMAQITNPLLESIESAENIERLIDLILESAEHQNSSLVYGIDVLLTILEPKTSTYIEQFDSQCSEQDRLKKERERILIASNGIKNVVTCCLKHLNRLHDLLVSIKSSNETFRTTHIQSMPLFGSKRLALVKLFAKLISLNNKSINETVVELGTLNVIIDYAFEYKWNNFLHTQVLNIFTNLFNTNDSLSRIIESIDVEAAKRASKAAAESESSKSPAAEDSKMETDSVTASEKAAANADDKVIENVEMMSPATDVDSFASAEPKPPVELAAEEKKDPAAAAAATEAKATTAESSDSLSKRIVIEHLFNDCQIIKKITNAWLDYFDSEKNEVSTSKEKSPVEVVEEQQASTFKPAAAAVEESSSEPKTTAEETPIATATTITTAHAADATSPAAESQPAVDEASEQPTTTSKSEPNKPKAAGAKLNSVGYIGHLTLISNVLYNITRDANYSKVIQSYLSSDSLDQTPLINSWRQLNEIKIYEINKINSKELVRNPHMANISDLNSDVSPISSLVDIIEPPSDDLSQKKLKDFQKEMKINCVDNFSLSENHIINFQPKYPGDLFNKLQNISFQMDSTDETMQLFEQVCSQRDNMCLSINETSSGPVMEEDMWITKEIKFDDEFTNTNNEAASSESDEAKNTN